MKGLVFKALLLSADRRSPYGFWFLSYYNVRREGGIIWYFWTFFFKITILENEQDGMLVKPTSFPVTLCERYRASYIKNDDDHYPYSTLLCLHSTPKIMGLNLSNINLLRMQSSATYNWAGKAKS